MNLIILLDIFNIIIYLSELYEVDLLLRQIAGFQE